MSLDVSICVSLLTCSHQCRRLVQQRPSMCYYACVIMHVKDPQLSVIRVGHCGPLAGFCLSLYDLHALNRDVNMIQTNKQTNPHYTIFYRERPPSSECYEHIFLYLIMFTLCVPVIIDIQHWHEARVLFNGLYIMFLLSRIIQ